MALEAAQLLTPVIFAAAVAAIVIFGPRRGRMLPDEKERVSRTVKSWVSVAVAGIASVYMERWLSSRFGLSYWPSLGIMLGLAIIVALLVQAVRGLIDKRVDAKHGS